MTALYQHVISFAFHRKAILFMREKNITLFFFCILAFIIDSKFESSSPKF